MTIYAIPGHFPLPRPKTSQKLARFSSVRVGRNSIRPTNGHAGGRMDRKIAIFQVAHLWDVLHTPHKRPHRWSNESNSDPIFDSPNKNEPKTGLFFRSFGYLYDHLWGVCRCALHGYLKKWRLFDSSGKNEPQTRRIFYPPGETKPYPFRVFQSPTEIGSQIH